MRNSVARKIRREVKKQIPEYLKYIVKHTRWYDRIVIGFRIMLGKI